MPMEKYISPFTDYGFKKLFGEEDSKSYLIDFINTFLPEYHRINSIQFNKNEYMPQTEQKRIAIIDLSCTTEKGETIIIELQRESQTFFIDRSVYYASCIINHQAKRGSEWRYQLQPVYMINILNFTFPHLDNQDLVYTVQLKTQHNDLFFKKLCFIYLTVPAFDKKENELVTNQDKWLYIFKNMANLDHIPESLQTPAFNDLFHKAEVSKMNAEQYAMYSQDLHKEWDDNGVLSAKLIEGIEQGHQEKAIIIAKKMLARNTPIEYIVEDTGLSKQDIENLKK